MKVTTSKTTTKTKHRRNKKSLVLYGRFIHTNYQHRKHLQYTTPGEDKGTYYLGVVRKGQLAQGDDTLSFWTSSQCLFPQLFTIGQDLTAAYMLLAYCERIFSIHGHETIG